MPGFLLSLHSGVRYLVLLAGLVTIVLAAGVGGRPVTRQLRTAWKAFVGLLDLQALAGLLVILTRPFEAQYIGHFAMMLAALAVAHGAGVAFRRRPAERQTGRLLLGSALWGLALVVGGILALGRSIV